MRGACQKGQHQAYCAQDEVLCGEKSSKVERYHDGHANDQVSYRDYIENNHLTSFTLTPNDQVLDQNSDAKDYKKHEDSRCD